jgi:HK97 family phage prohead protease
MPVKTDREYRAMLQPLTAAATTQKRIDSDFYVEGFATTFDAPYVLWEYDGVKYMEQIDRHALDGADMSDVIMQYDHSGKVLARLSNRTLGMEATDHGLFIFADLSMSRAAQDMYEEINNKLITKMSWAFTVKEESYNTDTHTRTILRIKKVYDVSAVSYPANGETDISARSWVDGVIDAEKREAQARARLLLQLKLNLEG